MFEKIIRFSLNNKPIVAFLTFVLIGFGIYSMQRIPVDAVPDITNNQVQVVTVSPSLAPQEVEKFITYPLEITFANITDVQEIRSVSRYGLSVVTVVFDEDVPILDARQLINEQIQLAAAEIPPGLGQPEMLPITTGLGEVFQYTLEVEPGYEERYDITELRTIQDWIVKRQLSGIPGIVEISSFGGKLKQYEISVDPAQLRQFDVSLTELYKAIARNNENTGGSYIEKGPGAYYIRAEGIVESVDDLENIVVKRVGGQPILVKDLADVTFGSAPRFGAMTKNGKGEAVGGITLMLKGANSSAVIKEVKERIEQVQKTLPEGVHIDPYLDRAELVKSTTNTLATNLIEGALIVIFVLILLLGNMRSGLIVASVIPLSLLFAFIMMHLFGVSANLMSLGAVDFGIVIDGAVIIVESIVYQLHRKYNLKNLSQKQMDKVVEESTTSIYKSAAFGVFIILIVFIPILTLTGIEGKTFRPMAQTFIFAILGAFLLSLTYVPVVASVFMKKKVRVRRNFSDRIIDFLKWTYKPVLELSLRFKYTILTITLVVFAVSIVSFKYLGGEFIPTLGEGDLAMQMTVPPGSSLTQSINTATKAEKILLAEFPEVEQVISKIGTAEVPTDPMAIEDADIMIILKDKEEWESAETREGLVDKMKTALAVIPSASFDFTQPIQLRFNELMTGVKTDIGVKIFGEDLDELYKQANHAARIIDDIPGASDIMVEQVAGLPQAVIRYNRKLIAQHGVQIEALNDVVESAFSGKHAGVVFEGERKFDIVVRFKKQERQEIDLSKLFVRDMHGQMIPLCQLATVEYIEGPAQISRDDTKRRVTIGINVRNRDVESLVAEIDKELNENLVLKPGYTLAYSGQFENLKDAKKRLMVAVPIALLLIFILLFFTFNSFKYAVLIFSAVPLSAVGGIAALWLRDMPFSISAGVGFIALFGVAVLNGIVLISYYNQLKEEGLTDIDEIVRKGALTRLRPVLMTASTDILGFLPMAISTSAGAEVQRPLATVVIGGIITATMLTMIILPILYKLFTKPPKVNVSKVAPLILLVIGFSLFGSTLKAQEKPQTLNLEQALQMAEQNHASLKNALLEERFVSATKGSVCKLGPTTVTYEHGQLNSDVGDYAIRVEQELGNLFQGFKERQVVGLMEEQATVNTQLTKQQLHIDVKQIYYAWLYHMQRLKVYKDQRDLFERYAEVAHAQYQYGETTQLQKTMGSTAYASARNQLNRELNRLIVVENQLKTYMQQEGDFIPANDTLTLYQMDREHSDSLSGSMQLKKQEQELSIALKRKQAAMSGLFPSLRVGYFTQQIDGVEGFTGWSAGVAIPLFQLSTYSKLKQEKIRLEQKQNEVNQFRFTLQKRIDNAIVQLHQLQNELIAMQENDLEQAAILMQSLRSQLEHEEIDYAQFVRGMEVALKLKLQYLDTLNEYNQLTISLEQYL